MLTMEKLINAVIVSNYDAVVFLGLKKAFDTTGSGPRDPFNEMKHQRHQWFQSYLEDRTQMCSINGFLSCSCTFSCGFPLGTIDSGLQISYFSIRPGPLSRPTNTNMF